jgi:hypothetical protein
MQAISNPVLVDVPPHDILFRMVINVFDFILFGSALAYTLLAVVMLFAQALYLNTIVARQRLFNKTTYIPAFVYLLLTSLHTSFSYFTPALLMNWCLLGGIHILLRFHQTHQPRKDVFNAGFLLALLALMHFPAIGYFLLLFIALVLLRSFNPGEWVVTFMGYLTPAYFWLGILFLADGLDQLKHWPHIDLFLPHKPIDWPYTIGIITGLIVLFTLGMYALQGLMGRTSVFNRRNWVMVLFCLLISVLVAIGTDIKMTYIWLIAMPALSLIICHALYLEKNKRFSNFAFYFSLLLVIFCQLAI